MAVTQGEALDYTVCPDPHAADGGSTAAIPARRCIRPVRHSFDCRDRRSANRHKPYVFAVGKHYTGFDVIVGNCPSRRTVDARQDANDGILPFRRGVDSRLDREERGFLGAGVPVIALRRR